jgi:phospholipid/cholesterol/gamma-HCH transport system substrate-binding protein
VKLKREHKTGIVVILGLVLLYFGVNFLKGFDVFQKNNVYTALYNNVEGLADASPLYLNGYKIGQVVSTEMVHTGNRRIAVTYQITERGLFLPDDSEIQIYSADLFTKAAQLIPGKSKTAATPGDTLIGDTQLSITETFNQELDPIKKRAEALLASVDSVLASFQAIMNENARGDITESFHSIRLALQSFQQTTERLDKLVSSQSDAIEQTMGNLAAVSDTIEAHNADIGSIIGNMEMISDSLANGGISDIMGNIRATSERLHSILQKMDDGEGTLGQLANNDSLYTNLTAASNELDLLLEDMRLHPNRYVQVSVFGKKEKKPSLSDKDIERLKERIEKSP